MSLKPTKPLRVVASKRGRKPKFYTTSWGEPIAGLGRNADGRWRIIATQQTFVEPDEKLAIHRFRTWESSPRQEELDVPHRTDFSRNGTIPFSRSYTPGEEFWPWLRELLLTDINYVARKAGLPRSHPALFVAAAYTQPHAGRGRQALPRHGEDQPESAGKVQTILDGVR